MAGKAQYMGAFHALAWVVFANVPLSTVGHVPNPDTSGEWGTDSTPLWDEWTITGIL